MLRLPVHRIIPFSNVEGLGNRTSIFVQGCNMNCKYCHNSETIPMTSPDTFFQTVDELVEKVRVNMPFIRGVTVSGGEATIYHKFLAEFFKEIHKLGITCYVDTNGLVDIEKMAGLIDETDKFLFDIKSDSANVGRLCFEGAGAKLVDEDFTFKNLTYLLERGKVEEVRLVYLKDYFDDDALIKRIADTMKGYDDVFFKLIRVHIKGLPDDRVASIKKNIPSPKRMREIEDMARKNGIKKIITIM